MLFIKIYGGIVINYVVISFLSILLFFEIYHELTIFQQAGYKIKEYFKHFRKYYLYSLSGFVRLQTVLLGILYCWYDNWFLGLLTLFFIFGCIVLKEKKILTLKITKRISRMFFTIIIIYLIQIFTVMPLLFINIYIVPILIIVTNIINAPIENLINRYYIEKAKNKIGKLELIKIGITGSYGKTSCKYFLSSILSSRYLVHKTPKSYNTCLGITKDILNNLEDYNEIYIAEMGATKQKDIEKINNILNINIGIITSIGTQHLDSFKTIENVLKTKLELLKSKNIDTLIINADNEYLDEYEYPEHLKVIKVGIKNKNVNYSATNLVEKFNYISFQVNDILFEANLNGIHNVTNLLLVYAVCKELKLSDFEIIEEIKNLESVEHRLALIKKEGYQILDDSFNSNFEGFISALNVLNKVNTIKILITPGLVDQKEKLKEYYEKIGDLIVNVVDYVYLIDNENIYILVEYFKSNNFAKYIVVNSFEEAMKLVNKQENYSTVLIENDLTDYYLSRG